MQPNVRKRLVVLVVEDELLVRMDAMEIIELEGFAALEAKHAEDAILILEQRDDVHLIFTDINMPGSMDGLKLTHFVRNRWPPVKIVATSGHERLSDEDLPAGGKFLPKPYTAGQLGKVLREMAA